MTTEIISALTTAILDGDAPGVRKNVEAALNAQIEAGVILNDVMIPAMKQVGLLFEEGEYFIPEMLISARAMKEGLAVLKPHLVASNVQTKGRVAIGTVQGDLHDIGKNLVAVMLEGAGFEVLDLGVDVPAEKFIEVARNHSAEILAMSALLTTTMPKMKETIDALKTAGVRDQVKIMIGGAPITSDYALKIGADGYSEDASRAVGLAASLMGEQALI